jgi:hypothetical protein
MPLEPKLLARLALAALLALAPSLGQAQFATIGPTPAVTDNGDRIATTAWVNNLLAGGISGNLVVNGNLTVGGILIDANGELMTNIVAPSTPAAGLTRVYVDSTTKVLTFKNGAGTVGNAVVPSTAVANQFMTGISAAGVITRAQPNFTDLAGQGSCAQEPALTGDVTTPSGSCATTFATVNANVGSFGSATQTVTFTANAKGLVTAASAQNIAIPFSQVTSSNYVAPASWTPADASGASLTFSTVTAIYTRLGNAVTAQFTLTYPSTANGSSTAISGLPVASNTSGAGLTAGTCTSNATSELVQNVVIPSNSTTMNFFNVNNTRPTNTQMSTFVLNCFVHYITN